MARGPFEKGQIERVENILRAAGYFPILTDGEKIAVLARRGRRPIDIARDITSARDAANPDPFARIGE